MALAVAVGLGMACGQARPKDGEQSRFDARLAEVVFEHLDTSNGLANPIVTAFAEDGDGFLWVGSQNGLQRWDGYRFWSYKTILGDAMSLPDNMVKVLYTDSRGRLWVGTSSGGLAMYDREKDKFVRYRSSPSDLNRVRIFAITGDGARGLWIGSDTGLDHLNPDSGKFSHAQLAVADGRQPKHASGVVRAADGTLWVGTEIGLQRSLTADPNHADNGFFQPISLRGAKAGANAVAVLFCDRGGRLWVGTLHGAYVVNRANAAQGNSVRPDDPEGMAHAVIAKGSGSELLATESYLSIGETAPGEIWLGTRDVGILAMTPMAPASSAVGRESLASDLWEVRHLNHDASVPASLSDDTVRALYLGRPGIMWAGTQQGVSYLDTTQKNIFALRGGPGRNSVIRDANVYSVLARRDGSVWLGLTRQGIDILDSSGKKTGEIRTGTSDPETTLPPAASTGLVEGADGSVYISTSQGLYRAAPRKSGSGNSSPGVRRVPIGAEASAQIICALPDAGKLWLGGNDGLWILDPEDSRGPAKRAELLGQLTDQRVTVLLRDERWLWIGTQNGLNRVNLDTHIVDAILPNGANPAALGAGYISSLLRDRRGRLWVGTYSGGIDVLEDRDAKGGARFHRIVDGLPNENVDKLLEANNGKIWASTDGGLAVIDPDTFEMRVLGRADGVVLSAYWNDSGAVTANGELLFGGIGGLTVARPALMKAWDYQPPVKVTNARIGEWQIPLSRFNSGLREYPIWIPPDQNNLTLDFSALDYTAPDLNRYEYKLDGFDSRWITADATMRLARYTNLPPGNYMLELRGSNREGVWAPTLRARIKVLPAWFQTTWFFVLAVVLALLLLFGIFVLSTAYQRRRRRELERQVALRTAELKDSQQKLEYMAYRDALTGLPNRRMFTEHFKQLLALKRREEGSFSVLLMDFDRFKPINDTYGHDAGDAVLIEMAHRMSALVRESDCLARLGGDEFALLLAQSHDTAGTRMVCSKIVESFVAPVVFEGKQLRTSPSIGIAIYPIDGDTQDELYKAADLALYQTKRNGGNGCSWTEKCSAHERLFEAASQSGD